LTKTDPFLSLIPCLFYLFYPGSSDSVLVSAYGVLFGWLCFAIESTTFIFGSRPRFFCYMTEKKSISALVTGGEASAGPPLGPALGPMGINVLQVVNSINDKTKDFSGMKVPVKVEVDPDTKKFTVEVGVPPTAALINKEAGVAKGSGAAGTAVAGNIGVESAIKIAKIKIDSSYAKDIEGAVKEVIGTCLSLGMQVENKPAKEVYDDIKAGKYDEAMQKV
jgi:large subunit ribosomal protein L11